MFVIRMWYELGRPHVSNNPHLSRRERCPTKTLAAVGAEAPEDPAQITTQTKLLQMSCVFLYVKCRRVCTCESGVEWRRVNGVWAGRPRLGVTHVFFIFLLKRPRLTLVLRTMLSNC